MKRDGWGVEKYSGGWENSNVVVKFSGGVE